ncbi:TonB-dependent receptor plug domain-containing protein [Dyadobacter subterraneus]|uniref:TonB-dependent receptor n=1 Tax=Dyadobacter subterraneus TaxID=2773304 RepID=A0ABR9W8H7_9BACT|nr:TonB-dependent receptor [Dyadobacter subterraneus]MBE9461783.1 TonB-dependent receptor [Dyadobacter subterraneus]
MKLNIYILILLVLCISGQFLPVYGQDICGEFKIAEAQKKYSNGNFQEVFGLLDPCLKEGFTDLEKINAYKILSMTYLAIDSTEKATENIKQMLTMNPAYEPDLDLSVSVRFIAIVNQLKNAQERVVRVSSVSKKLEDINKAPATVMVLTGEEIRQRGYIDLEALFSDLPGFDVSRTYGSTYSNIYQRGYRSSNTERTLFMINGIEENDFWGNFVYWNRQFPISNVSRIEIVYGPASTMYGANAFLGVVNVITKQPGDFIKKDKKVGVSADMGYGAYKTKFADVTAAAKFKNVVFSLTSRGYYSNEQNLSKYNEYNFNPADYDKIDYKKIMSVTTGAAAFVTANKIQDGNPYYTVARDINGNVTAANLTDLGANAARNFDKAALQGNLNGSPIGYSNKLEHFYIKGSLKVSDFTLGFQNWQNIQGSLTYSNDNSRAGSANGNIWEPRQSLYYAIYEKEIIKDKLVIINTSQYRTTQINDHSRIVTIRNYSNKALTGASLLKNTAPFWRTQFYYQQSQQYRNELKMLYNPNSRLDIVGGLEVRQSVIQGDYKKITIDSTLRDDYYVSAEDLGKSDFDNVLGGNLFGQINIGAYAQGTYEVNKSLRLTLGERFDYSRIRRSGGYGAQFNPRVAVVYTPGKFVIKAIYARSFQDASSRDRYSTSAPTRLIANPNLKPEGANNYEISFNFSPVKNARLDVSVYHAIYKDIIEEISVPYNNGYTLQKNNTGKSYVTGVQAVFDYKISRNFSLYSNYTFTDAKKDSIAGGIVTDAITNKKLIVGDIARNHFNAGINGVFLNNDRLNVNLRFNYVSRRRVGQGTSVPANPQPNGFFPSFSLINTAITYKLTTAIQTQLIVNNVLNAQYSDPGIRSANGIEQAYRTPQKGINSMLRVILNF